MLHAKEVFQENIFARANICQNFLNLPIEATGLIDDFPPGLELTHFDDLYDTLIYSRLIQRALNFYPDVSSVIDLGTGSAIPPLLAIYHLNRPGISITGLDIDEYAQLICEKNAECLGLRERFTFRPGPLKEMLRTLSTGAHTLIASNPPYIATPPSCSDRHFVPVNGGIDGSELLQEILRVPYASGTPLAILWGSLTDPHEVVPLIQERYHLAHVETYRVHFGNYTRVPAMETHLKTLLGQGRVFYEELADGQKAQYVIGTILRAR